MTAESVVVLDLLLGIVVVDAVPWLLPVADDVRICPEDGKLCATTCPHKCIDLAPVPVVGGVR